MNIQKENFNGSVISFVSPVIKLRSGYVISLMCISGVGQYNNLTISDTNLYRNTDSRTHEIRTLTLEMSAEEIEEMGNLLLELAKEIKEKKPGTQNDSV